MSAGLPWPWAEKGQWDELVSDNVLFKVQKSLETPGPACRPCLYGLQLYGLHLVPLAAQSGLATSPAGYEDIPGNFCLSSRRPAHSCVVHKLKPQQILGT